MPQKYWAYISYSHADEAVASWLHNALETYRIPKNLVGGGAASGTLPSTLFPVFRDRDELPSFGSLGDKINAALSESRNLIVIASRSAVRSRWVNEEIRAFKTLGRADRILGLIVDGEPFASDNGNPEAECFPTALRFEVDADGNISETPVELIAADLRPGKDAKKDALLKIIAGILDLGLDDLKQRDQQRRQRRLQWILAASLAATVMTSTLAVLAVMARNEAQIQRQIALEQRGIAQTRQRQAEGLIQFMLGDLRDRLTPIGKLDVLDAVGDQALDYFAQVDPKSQSKAELSARAQALRQIGEVRVNQGRLAEASPAFKAALEVDSELLQRQPKDAELVFNIAQSEFYVGYDLFLQSDYAGALPWFEKYLQRAQVLVSQDAKNPRWQAEEFYALDTLATVNLKLGHHAECLKLTGEAIALSEKSEVTGDTEASLHTRASSAQKAASCAYLAGDMQQALDYAAISVALHEQRARSAPENAPIRFDLANSQITYASFLLGSGQFENFATTQRSAAQALDQLVESDPENQAWANARANALMLEVEKHIIDENFQQALAVMQTRQTDLVWNSGRVSNLGQALKSNLRSLAFRLALEQQLGLDEASRLTAHRVNPLVKEYIEKNNRVDSGLKLACYVLNNALAANPDDCRQIAAMPLEEDNTPETLLAKAVAQLSEGAEHEYEQVRDALTNRGAQLAWLSFFDIKSFNSNH